MNAKAKGTRNEHRSMRLLEAAGYRCTRSAASLGEWDIVAIGPRDVVLVQVKTRDWPGSVEMETLREFTAPPMARKLVHRWRDRQRLPDVRETTMQTITMTLDDTEARAVISELEAFAERFPKVTRRLLERGEHFFELLSVDPELDSAGGANELRTRLEPTEFLRGFMVALRASDGE